MKKILTIFRLIFLSCFVFPFSIFAQDVLDLNVLIDEALVNNPQLNAYQKRSKALWERPPQVKSWDDPKITLGVTNLPTDDFDFNKQDMTQKSVSISQNIPFPGISGLKEKAAVARAKGAESDLADIQIQTVYNLKKLFFNLYFVCKSIKVNEQNIDLMNKFIDITQTKYEVGNGLQEDIFKAQVALYKLDEKMISLKQKEMSLRSNMKRILNRKEDNLVAGIPLLKRTEQKLNISDLMNTASEENPRLKRLNHLSSEKEAEYLLSKKSYFPKFSITAAYGQRDDWDSRDRDRPDFMSVLFGIDIPIWFKQKQSRKVTENRLITEQIKSEIVNEKNSIIFKLEDILAKIEKGERLYELYEEKIIPEANQSLEADMSAYQVGKLDFLSLLNSQMTLLDYETALHKVVSDLEKDYAALEVVVGKRIF